MSAPTVHPNNRSPAVCPPPETQSRPKVPLRKKWPRLKKNVRAVTLKEEATRRFGYEPHEWQVEAALKVLEGTNGVVVAGTGKGKTMVFTLLGLAVQLSGTKGHYVIVSPLKALEGDQVRAVLGEKAMSAG